METRRLECTCRCGYVWDVHAPARYGNPKCPDCGQPAVKVVDTKFVPYTIWNTSIFYVLPLLVVLFIAAWALGFSFSMAVPVVVCGGLILATAIINYWQDREYIREHPALKPQMVKAPPKRP